MHWVYAREGGTIVRAIPPKVYVKYYAKYSFPSVHSLQLWPYWRLPFDHGLEYGNTDSLVRTTTAGANGCKVIVFSTLMTLSLCKTTESLNYTV